MVYSSAYPLIWITSFLTIASFIKLSRIYMPSARSGLQDGALIERGILSPGFPATFSVAVLALLCLFTGLYGSGTGELLHRALYGSPVPETMEIYSAGKLLSILPLILSGTAVYLLLRTSWGKKITGKICSLKPDLNTVLSFFFVGLILFAAAAY
jgi:hypothetical protein